MKRQSEIRNEVHAHLRFIAPDPGTHCRQALSAAVQLGRGTEGGDRVRQHPPAAERPLNRARTL
jgi:hypothetical protein